MLRVGTRVRLVSSAARQQQRPPMVIAHIDRNAPVPAAVLFTAEDYAASTTQRPDGSSAVGDPYAFLSRRSRLAPLSALAPVEAAH